MIKKGLYLMRFIDHQDALAVAQKGFYHFDQKPFIVKAWNPKIEINVDAIASLLIWIQLPELDIKYWGLQSLSKLGSMLGIPIKTDKFTKEKTALQYARLLVEMKVTGPFPLHIDFINDKDEVIRQEVRYKWQPVKCNHCKMWGHKEGVCKKRNEGRQLRQEWREVSRNHIGSGDEVPPTCMEEPMDEGFIVPRQRRGRQQDRFNAIQDPPVQIRQNTFQVLLEEEGMEERIPHIPTNG